VQANQARLVLSGLEAVERSFQALQAVDRLGLRAAFVNAGSLFPISAGVNFPTL
jgi:hypothetical protein